MIQRVPVSVYAEITPNPAVMKFVSNKRLTDLDSIEYKNIEDAQNAPLISKLFYFPFVKEVFVSGNYVAITKYSIVEWEDVAMEIRELLTKYLQDNAGFITGDNNQASNEEVGENNDGSTKNSNAPIAKEELGEIETRIVQILDEYVKPAVQNDGGNIAFISYENKIVNVLLQGACSGCPSSTATLKQGIQNILQQMLPTLVDDVVAVNG